MSTTQEQSLHWMSRTTRGEDGPPLGSKVAMIRIGRVRATEIGDLPHAVLTTIFTLVSSPRVRNNMALACRDWYYLERQTRCALKLRGNVCNLISLPCPFRNVTQLDLSCCSPWGYSVFQSTSTGGEMVGQLLRDAFPNVKDISIYVRDAVDIQMVAWLWPEVESLRLVRWHQRAMEPRSGVEIGSEVESILKCQKLNKLDLSKFYCWTEDIPPAFEAGIATASNLVYLDLLKLSSEGFKTTDISIITSACQNLEQLFLLCEFDPRLFDAVGDSALATLAVNCPRLRVLHLVDRNEWGLLRSDLNDDYAEEDSIVTRQGLITMFKSLPSLQELALNLGQNIRESGPALDQLFTHCTKLTSLQLSHFHGLWCGPLLDGIAGGMRLIELTVKNSVDFSDSSLSAVGRGCRSLRKQLPALETLRALEPVRNKIKRLHLDCVWDEELVASQARLSTAPGHSSVPSKFGDDERLRYEMERRGFTSDFWGFGRKSNSSSSSSSSSNYNKSKKLGGLDDGISIGATPERTGCGASTSRNWQDVGASSGRGRSRSWQQPGEEAPDEKMWDKLQYLSLWVDVGVVITPLPSMGLGRCPALTEMTIKVEGDCKSFKKPGISEQWGLASLSRYPCFKKLNLDLSEVVSFSMSAPEGKVDLQVWERYFLGGLDHLELCNIDYRPPSDKDLNHRGLSLPAAGVLSQCVGLRKLIVHGTAHEHFLSMLQGCQSLRDFQLRSDYYPAPEYETSTELRIEATRRFEAALADKGWPD
ncbi:hypothetical protein R1sor_018323 [Riccia sorocarpa]|uniref:COI1 F-box domain-containing protein n=1 Tax=Riccia sorocarpa TaxID=122646 RepID=A0ABD3IDF4_9MARC